MTADACGVHDEPLCKYELFILLTCIESGVGRGGEKYSPETIKEVLVKGSEWALEKGFATEDDLEELISISIKVRLS